MKRKIYILMIFLMLTVTLSGCFDYKELNNYAIITGIAIDKGEEGKKYKVTCEVLTFETGRQGKIKPVLVDSEGDTLIEATRPMITSFAKRMFGGHFKALVISEEVAREGVFDIIDYFIRSHEARSIVTVFTTKECKASDLFENTAMYYDVAGYEMDLLGANDSNGLGYGRKVFLYQAFNTLLSEGAELTLPVLELKEEQEKKTFHLYGVGLFRDDKLIEMIEGEKARYFLSFLNEFNAGQTVVKLDNGSLVTYELINVKTKTKVKIKKDRYDISTTVKLYFYVRAISVDKNEKKVHLSDEKQSEVLKEDWEKQMMEMFGRIQEVNTDVFSFGRLIMGNDFKKWKKEKDKRDILGKVDIKINVEVTNLGTGKLK